jgi:integrase
MCGCRALSELEVAQVKESFRGTYRVRDRCLFIVGIHANELTGPLGTHSLRKTLPRRAWEFFQHDLLKVQKALGHQSIQSTISNLGVDHGKIKAFFMAA